MVVQYTGHMIKTETRDKNNYYHWFKFWSCDLDVQIILSIISIKKEKLLNSNNKMSKPEILRLLDGRRFQLGCIFVESNLLNTRNLLQNLTVLV